MIRKVYLDCSCGAHEIEPKEIWVSGKVFNEVWKSHDQRDEIIMEDDRVVAFKKIPLPGGMDFLACRLSWSNEIPDDVAIVLLPGNKLKYRKLR